MTQPKPDLLGLIGTYARQLVSEAINDLAAKTLDSLFSEFPTAVHVARCPLCRTELPGLLIKGDGFGDTVCQVCANALGWNGVTPTVTTTYRVFGVEPKGN